MTSIPGISTYSLTDQIATQNWQVSTTNNQSSATDSETSAASQTTAPATTQAPAVSISQEGIDRLQAETLVNDPSTVLKLSTDILQDIPAELSDEQRQILADPLVAQYPSVESSTLMLRAVSTQIEQTYTSLHERILADYPDLKDAHFGFTVDASGKIVISSAPDLSDEQIVRLSQALNASPELVTQANQLADTQIALFEAQGSYPDVTFNRDTYAQTIDIGAELLSRNAARSAPGDETAIDVHQQNWSNSWRQQVLEYGVRL